MVPTASPRRVKSEARSEGDTCVMTFLDVGVGEFLFARLENVVEYDNDAYHSYAEPDICEVVVVLLDFGIELLARHHCPEPVAEGCEDDVPCHGSKPGEDDELAEVHPCESCGDGYELAHCRHESAYECRYRSVGVEVFFGVAHLVLVEQKCVALAAPGKFGGIKKFRDRLAANPQATSPLSLGAHTVTPRGVFRDFQVASLYVAQQPLVIFPLEEPDTCHNYYLLFKSSQMTAENMTVWKEKMQEVCKQSNFHLWYYPYTHQNAYGAEKDMCTTVEIITYLALVIVLLGLFGFTGDEVARRTKEIAVRKVNGASVLSITLLLLRNICLLALCALPFGLAGAYYMGSYWLDEFAWRIPLSVWLLTGGAAITFGVIVGTVLLKSRQGIKTQPAEALKNE